MRLGRRTVLLCLFATMAMAQENDRPVFTNGALIEQLGHPVYAERRDARRRLLSAGLGAFEALRDGRDHADPEVAEACSDLLTELTLDWAWLGDPTQVRLLLNEYDRLQVDGRLEIVSELIGLPDRQGVDALARLARFEPSDLVAGRAAAALLARDKYALDERLEAAIGAAVEELRTAYGSSARTPASWLELADGEASPDAWRVASQREAKRLRGAREETTLGVVATLHWRWLRVSLRAADSVNALAAVDALADFDPDQRARRVRRVLEWAAEAGQPAIGERVAEAYATDLQNKRGLYARASLATAAADPERADRLVSEAIEAAVTEQVGTQNSTDFGPRVLVAEELLRSGQASWAEAELAAASAMLEPLDSAALYARWRLSDRLLDRESYEGVVRLLTPLIELLDRSEEARKAYAEYPLTKVGYLPKHFRMKSRIDSQLVAREQMASALAARARGETEAEITSLREAIRADLSDADVVIAMHRVSHPPEAFAEETRDHVARLRREYEKQIWENADSPKPNVASQPFNHWAWLVSNTEGDFEKAVRYSQRSLAIRPDTAGYLDTLGRCLFSAGRVREAVETQRRAIELDPQRMQVMRRQLAEFERALADRESPAAGVE